MFLSNFKLILAGIVASIVVLFTYIFKRRGSKIEEQEKVIHSKDTEIKTQEQVHKTEVAKKELKEKIKTEEVKITTKSNKAKNETQKKIYDTPDGVEYKIEV